MCPYGRRAQSKIQVVSAKLKYKKIIDHEARANGKTASFLLFMNDKD